MFLRRCLIEEPKGEELGFISHAIPHPLKTGKLVTQSHFFKRHIQPILTSVNPADALFGRL